MRFNDNELDIIYRALLHERNRAVRKRENNTTLEKLIRKVIDYKEEYSVD